LFGSLGSEIDSSLLEGGSELSGIHLAPALGGGPLLVLHLRQCNELVLDGIQ
jgi:hypothetical protein